MVRKTFFAIVLSLSLPIFATSAHGQYCDSGACAGTVYGGHGGYGDCGAGGYAGRGCGVGGCLSRLLQGSGYYSHNCGRGITTMRAANLWAGYCSDDCSFQGGAGGCGGGCLGGCGLLGRLFRGGCLHGRGCGGFGNSGGYVGGCGTDGGYVGGCGTDGGYVGGCGTDGGYVGGGCGANFGYVGGSGCFSGHGGGGCLLGRIFSKFRSYNGCGCFQGCFGYPSGGCGCGGGYAGGGYSGGCGHGCGCLRGIFSRGFGLVKSTACNAVRGTGHLTNGLGHAAYGTFEAAGRKVCCLQRILFGSCGCGCGHNLAGVGQTGYNGGYFYNAPISTSDNFGFYSQGCSTGCSQTNMNTYQAAPMPQPTQMVQPVPTQNFQPAPTMSVPTAHPGCNSGCALPGHGLPVGNGIQTVTPGSSLSPAGEMVPAQVITDGAGS